MTTIIATVLLALMLAGVWALLERNHRRTEGMPHLPFGADPTRDADLNRVLHDMDVSRPAGCR